MGKKKRILFAGIILLLLHIGVGCSLLTPDSLFFREEIDRTTDTWSSSFDSIEERLVFLGEYLFMFSEVLDAEYHIVFYDNSGGMIPGPSDWDIRVALHIALEDIPLWTEGMQRLAPGQIDVGLWKELKSERFTWQESELVEYWKRPNSKVVLVVFPESGIVLKMATTTRMINWPELIFETW